MDFAVLNDTGYVYLLKGTGTAEFYRYNVARDTWEALPDAPAGTSGKPKYKDGSAIAVGSDSTLYCLKSNYNEVFRFDMRSGTWQSGQTNVPLYGASGRKKKVKKGGAIAWGHGLLTAIKGGGTFEFWKLDGADSTWREFPPVPPGDMNRKVGDGAGLEYAHGYYYVLKGGKSAELWRFAPAESDCNMVSIVSPRTARAGTALSPNALLTSAAAGRDAMRGLKLTLFDVTGRVVGRCAAGQGRTLLGSSLAPGVYLLADQDAAAGRACRKLVLVR